MTFVFGEYRLDARLRELRRENQRLHVEPQVFDLILHLLRNRERVVSQDELLETLWQGRFVSESTFRSRINAARNAIGDSGKRQRFIRTLSRRGLRFVGEVVEEDGADGAADGAADGGDLAEGRGRDVLRAAPEANGSRPTVAVLPFSNLSGDAAWEHYADAIAEDIITMLAKHRSLFVVARNSAFVFKNRADDLRRVGRALDAHYIVEGSLQKVAQRVRIGVHLVEAESGRLLWTDRHDSTLDSLFDVQDAITTKIASSIEPQIGSAERTRAENRHPRNFRAWDLFHLGVKHLYRSTPDDNRAAQRLLRQSLEHDPGLAQAYALLSYAITLSILYFDAEPEEQRLKHALDLARRGLELDDQDALIRFVHGRALLALRDYAGALEELRMSIQMNPALAVGYCGVGDSLAYEGRFEDAFPYFQKAIDLSPHDPQRWAFCAYRAMAHLFAGQFEEALDWAQRSVRVPNCHYWPFAHRVSALGHLQRGSEAAAAIDELMERRPDFTCALAHKQLFYVKDRSQLERYLQGLRKAGVPE
jgi:TolB-like protein/DNA-binding winged helix-turn-helix (wHTH) protein